jgi:hypothetical protein
VAAAAPRWADRVTAVAGGLITLGAVVWSFDLPPKLGILIIRAVHRGGARLLSR